MKIVKSEQKPYDWENPAPNPDDSQNHFETINKLESQIQKLKEEKHEFLDTLDILQKENDALKSNCQQKDLEMLQKDRILKNLETEYNDLLLKSETEKERLEQKEKQVDQLMLKGLEHSQQESKFIFQQEENEKLKSKIASLKKDLKDLEDQEETYRKQKEELEAEKSAMEKKLKKQKLEIERQSQKEKTNKQVLKAYDITIKDLQEKVKKEKQKSAEQEKLITQQDECIKKTLTTIRKKTGELDSEYINHLPGNLSEYNHYIQGSSEGRRESSVDSLGSDRPGLNQFEGLGDHDSYVLYDDAVEFEGNYLLTDEVRDKHFRRNKSDSRIFSQIPDSMGTVFYFFSFFLYFYIKFKKYIINV